MDAPHRLQEHVLCMLAHDLLNKVAAIIGFCDLLASDQLQAEKEVHLRRLRATALLIADMLNERPCSLLMCSPGPQKQVEEDGEKKPVIDPEGYKKDGTAPPAMQAA